MDEGPEPTATDTDIAEMRLAVAAVLTNEELTHVLDALFRKLATLEGQVVEYLDELTRREASLPPEQPT